MVEAEPVQGSPQPGLVTRALEIDQCFLHQIYRLGDLALIEFGLGALEQGLARAIRVIQFFGQFNGLVGHEQGIGRVPGLVVTLCQAHQKPDFDGI